MKNKESIADELYNKLSKFSDLQMLNAQGEITNTIDEAVIFQVNYGTSYDEKIITFNMFDPEVLQVLYSNHVTNDMVSKDRERWYSFIDEIRDFAMTRMMKFEVKNFTKARFDKNDFDFIHNNSQYSTKDATMESRMYGSRRSSYAEQANTRLIVRHDTPIDEEIKGARSRNIKNIYIENADGERFLVPRNHMPTARALARHVANEGAINDDIAEAIVEMHDEMKTLSKFNRKTKNTEGMMEGADKVVEAAKCRYKKVKETLESLQKQTGYSAFAESFEGTSQLDEDEDAFESLRSTLTKQTYNEEFDDVLPYLNRAIREKEESDLAEKNKQIEEKAHWVLGMENIQLKGGPELDETLRSKVDEMIEESRMMQFESEDAKKSAMKETQKNILEFFQQEVLERMSDTSVTEGLDLEEKIDEGMAKHMFMLWKNGNVGYDHSVTESDLDMFETWVGDLGEGWQTDDAITAEMERASEEMSDYAYEVGNTHMDYDFFIQAAEMMAEGDYDAVEEHIMSADTEPREKALELMSEAGMHMEEMAAQWVRDMETKEPEMDAENDIDLGDDENDPEAEFGADSEEDDGIDDMKKLAGL